MAILMKIITVEINVFHSFFRILGLIFLNTAQVLSRGAQSIHAWLICAFHIPRTTELAQRMGELDDESRSLA